MIKDSGDRTQFYDEKGNAVGVRDLKGADKGRVDLVPLRVASNLYGIGYERSILNSIGLFMETGDVEHLYDAIISFCFMRGWSTQKCILEVSIHYKEGSEKYQPYNWQKGINISSFLSSGTRHLLQFLDGDKSESHDRAFIWNMLGAIWTMEYRPNMIDIPFEMLTRNKEVQDESERIS